MRQTPVYLVKCLMDEFNVKDVSVWDKIVDFDPFLETVEERLHVNLCNLGQKIKVFLFQISL